MAARKKKATAAKKVEGGRRQSRKTKLREYLVIWGIEIGAESVEAAAKEALSIMRDKNSGATHFHVASPGDRRVTRVLNRMKAVDLDKGKGEWMVRRRK